MCHLKHLLNDLESAALSEFSECEVREKACGWEELLWSASSTKLQYFQRPAISDNFKSNVFNNCTLFFFVFFYLKNQKNNQYLG